MLRWKLVFVLAVGAGCGDVPRAPKALPEPQVVKPPADAGPMLEASCDTGRPAGPMPASDACVNCGAANCFTTGAACVGDSECQTCIADVLSPACAQNALWKALIACLCTPTAGAAPACATICSDVCAVSQAP